MSRRRVGSAVMCGLFALALAPSVAGAAVSAKAEVEKLLDSALPLAEKMLTSHGEFFPYGSAISRDGQIVSVAADPGLGDHPSSASVIAFLEAALKQGARRGDYRASAVVVDVRVIPEGQSQPTDAVEVRLEHRDGYCVNYYRPYVRSSVGAVGFGEPFASKRTGTVFSACR